MKKQESVEVKTTEAMVKTQSAQVTPLEKWLNKSSLKDDSEVVLAASILTEVKDLYNKAEVQRKEITSPLNSVIKTVNAKVKPLTSKLESIERHIKGLIANYETQRRLAALKVAEKQAKIAEKKGADDLANDIREAALVKQVLPETNVTFRDNWKAKIQDQVLFLQWVLENPKDRLGFVELGTVALDGQAKATKGTSPIPGIEFVNERFACVRGSTF